MNTIEQAREVSLRICIAGYFDESETIDALITDLNEWRDEALSAQERFKAAEDKLASIKGQEPVARFNWNKGGFEWLAEYSYNKHNMKPLFLEAGAHPVPDVTKDSIRAAGGIVHSDGNVFFTAIEQIKAMLAAAKEQA